MLNVLLDIVKLGQTLRNKVLFDIFDSIDYYKVVKSIDTKRFLNKQSIKNRIINNAFTELQ